MSTITTQTTQASTIPQPQAERVSLRRLLWVAPVAAIVAAIANIFVREITVALGIISPDYMLTQPGAVFIATVIQTLLGAVVFAVIVRFARRPITVFRIVAVIALILSFGSPLGAMSGAMLPPGASPPNVPTVVIMMGMHVVAAVVSVGLLTTLAREK